MLKIRRALASDWSSIWDILEPVVRTGETYAQPRQWNQTEATAYWFTKEHEVWVAESSGEVLGTYYLKANQRGGGAHVANCAYVTAPDAGGRGVATAMCMHSLERASERGFLAMQFNFVISTNDRAIRLWQRLGFTVVGTLPKAFEHPVLGFVDAFVMFRELDPRKAS